MASANDDATVRTTVTIPKTDYEEIEKIARDKRVSVAWVVREALIEYLSENPHQELGSAIQKGGKK